MGERRGAENDYVRIEIELALSMNKLVIPVLVNGATMPNVSDLPESIRDFGYRNSIPIRPNPDFAVDMQRLLGGLEKSLNYHNELLEEEGVLYRPSIYDGPRLPRILTTDTVHSAWVEAQRLIFEHSFSAGDLIVNLPNLMEYAKVKRIEDSVVICTVSNKIYLEKLNSDIRVKWVERALSRLLGQPIHVQYELDEPDKPKYTGNPQELDDIPF